MAATRPCTLVGRSLAPLTPSLLSPHWKLRSLHQHSCVGSMNLQSCEGTARVLKGIRLLQLVYMYVSRYIYREWSRDRKIAASPE